MAAYTSAASGDWVANAATVWNAAGAYPGDTAAQADTVTIANLHTVDMDWTDLAGTASVTVQSGGTLRVSSVMTAADLTLDGDALVVDAGGLVTFEAGATRKLIVNGNISVTGTITQDSSGEATAFFDIAIECASDNLYKLTVNSGGLYTIKGRTIGTIATLTNGAITNNVNPQDFYVDAKVGWVVDDEVLFVKDAAIYEVVTLLAATGGGDFGGVFTKDLPDNCRAYHLTRSSNFYANTPANTSSINVSAGGDLDADYAGFRYLDAVSIASTDVLVPVLGCVVRDVESGHRGIYLTASCEIQDTVIYTVTTGTGIFTTASVVLTRCYMLQMTAGQHPCFWESATMKEFVLRECEFVSPSSHGFITCQNTLAENTLICERCYAWGAAKGFISINWLYVTIFRDCVLGRDPGGNQSQITGWGNIMTGYADNCITDFSGTAISVTTMPPLTGRFISTNHNQVSGARVEYQRYDVIINTADADFYSGVCDGVDPASETGYSYYRIVFPCDTGKTPTLTIYHKQVESGANSIDDPITVALGDRRCGLTGVSPTTITPNNIRTQQDITFTGTTDRAGEVEVILGIRDETGETGATERLGDFSVAGNL